MKFGRPFYILLLTLLSLALAITCNLRVKKSAFDAFREGESLLTGEHPDSAQDYFETAADNPQLHPWALLRLGQLSEKLGNFLDAQKTLQEISGDSAASLDARVTLLRLQIRHPEVSSAREQGRELAELEQGALRANRKDIRDELELLKAEAAAKHGDIPTALVIYQTIRKSHIGKDIGRRAREAREALRLPEPPTEESIAVLIAEAQLLLKENALASALEHAQKARTITTRDTPAYFDALLVEEEILRALGRGEEADRVLAMVMADGPAEEAKKAILKMVKLAWNKNENERALGFLKSARSRFGEEIDQTSESQELAFVEARVLEDLKQDQEAIHKFRSLLERTSDPMMSSKCLRRLAWRAVRLRNYVEAANSFHEGYRRTQAALTELIAQLRESFPEQPVSADLGKNLTFDDETARAKVRAIRDLNDEMQHHLYWLADSLAQLSEEDRNKLFGASQSPNVLYQTLLKSAPLSYYGLLAGRALGVDASRSIATYFEKSKANSCTQVIPESLTGYLRELAKANLQDIATFETDWFLSQSKSSQQIEQMSRNISAGLPLNEDSARYVLTRIYLYEQFGHPDRGTSLADSLLKRPLAIQAFALSQFSEPETCQATLLALAFPRPYSPSFRKAAQETGTPLSLLYALSRTESFFDPNALSSKGARGLLQLLPSTAKSEGLKEAEDLFQPDIAIHYGSKHVARLLESYRSADAEAPIVRTAAAYNAGSLAANRWIENDPQLSPPEWSEIIPYSETRDYVRKIVLAKSVYEALQIVQEAGN